MESIFQLPTMMPTTKTGWKADALTTEGTPLNER